MSPATDTLVSPVSEPAAAPETGNINIPAQSAPKNSQPFWLIGIIGVIVLVLIGGTYFSLNFFQKQLDNQKQVVEPNVARVTQADKMVVGIDATFPPMEFTDENGQFRGYDVDLGNRIAEKLGVQAEFKNITWDDIFGALEKKEVDMVISSMSITDERKQKYDFSEPYINAGQVIITRKDNNTIKSTADLTGKIIAVQTGTTNEEEALKYTAKEMVAKFDDFILATAALKNGKADAIFSDLTGAKGIISANPDLKIASEPFTTETYGIMMRKGENDLVKKVDEILNSLRQQGVLVYLKQKWLE